MSYRHRTFRYRSLRVEPLENRNLLSALSWNQAIPAGEWGDKKNYLKGTAVAAQPAGSSDDVTFVSNETKAAGATVSNVSGSVGSVSVTKPKYVAQLTTNGDFSTVAAGGMRGTLMCLPAPQIKPWKHLARFIDYGRRQLFM